MVSFYARSVNGGDSWDPARLVDGKDERYWDDYGAGELAITSVGDDLILLVWAGSPGGHRWSQWSNDGGESWQPPELVAPISVFGNAGLRNFNNGLELIADSAGRVHLLTSGSSRLVHMIWEEGGWSEMDIMLPYNPEEVKMAIALGNEMHVVGTVLRTSGTR